MQPPPLGPGIPSAFTSAAAVTWLPPIAPGMAPPLMGPAFMVPKNSIPIVGAKGPFDYITAGGMFTILKVRDTLGSFDKDPGWYQNPPGTVASGGSRRTEAQWSKGVVMRIRFALLACAALAACASTTLETSSDRRTNPAAQSASRETPAQVLKPGFDPFLAYAGDAGPGPTPAHHHEHHEHHPAQEADGSKPPDTDAGPSINHSGHSRGKPAAQTPEKASQAFTCPMHPQIVRDKPGTCPICGMDLVPKKTQSAPPPHHSH